MKGEAKAKPKAENKALSLTGGGMPASVESLIARAIDKGTPVDTMEKILAMGREVRKEQAKSEYDKAMADFQAECPIIKKTKTVKNKDGTTRYKFAPIDSIIEQTKELIKKHGFSYTINTKLNGGITVICKITHEAGHSEISEFTVPIDREAYMNEAQKVASASTFAKRYAFLNSFGIMTGDEDDDSVESGKPSWNRAENHQPAPKPKTWIRDPLSPASTAQLKMIDTLLSDTETDAKSILDATNKARLKMNNSAPQATELIGLKKGEASQIIEQLKAKKDKILTIDADTGEVLEGEIVK